MEILRLEQLEDRIAPAGNITAVVTHGNLVITGDSEANSFYITQPDPLVQDFVIESMVTSINHQNTPQTMHDVTGSVAIVLNGGTDLVDINGIRVAGKVVLAGGDGDDYMFLKNSTVAGSVTYSGGTGDEDILLSGCTTGNVTVDYGAGTVIGSFVDSTVHGNMKIKGGSSGTDLLRSLAIDGALNLRLGNGATNAGIEDIMVGSAAITGGSGNDAIAILSSHFAGKLSINGGSHDLNTHIVSTHVDGAFTLKNGAGNSTFLVESSSVFASAVTVTTGAGKASNVITWSTLGIDEAHGTVSNVTFKSAGGRASTINLGEHEVPLDTQLWNSSVGGNLTVSYGATTADRIYLDTVDVGGSFTATAKGSTGLCVFDTDVHGNTKTTTGAGFDAVEFDGVHLYGKLAVNTGAETDTVRLGTGGHATGHPSFFDGAVSVNLGSGNDTLVAGLKSAGYLITYGAAVKFDGGAGSDTIDITGNNNAFAIDPVTLRFETTV
jgi:hypothetical protein